MYAAKRRARVLAGELPKKGVVLAGHGTMTRYSYGCRCKKCKAAMASYQAERRRARSCQAQEAAA